VPDRLKIGPKLDRLKQRLLKYWKQTPTVLKALATLVIALNAFWQLYSRVLSPPSVVTPVKVASQEKMAYPLPDKPSIAVLPFTNMSGDPKQEFFSDGMTEQIITALSKVPGLFVIARNSTFTYKGKPVKVKQVSEELGVRYVLEGSVQKSDDRVRVTAQLIDAITGNHLWAETYDRDMKDIFALQDEITLKVLTGVQVKLVLGADVARAQQRYAEKYYSGKQGLKCYLKIMEGTEYAMRRTAEDNNVARRIAKEVLATSPGVPSAYVLMGYVHYVDYYIGSPPQESVKKGIQMAQKAVALDDTFAEAHGLLSSLYILNRDYDKALVEAERAAALDPGGASVLARCAYTLVYAGRYEEAISLVQKALRLDPMGSQAYPNTLGASFLFTGRYKEAVAAYKKALQTTPNYLWTHIHLTATYSLMGREKEARTQAAEILRIKPNFTVDWFVEKSVIKDQSIIDKIANALRKAGLK
jgi:adenylate cyclase